MSVPTSPITFVGYHGCDHEHVENIKKINFLPSEGPEHLLGDGVYFFIEGFTCPIENAKKWAIFQCWQQKRNYTSYAVLKAEIAARNLLDITTTEGKEIVNFARDYAFADLPNRADTGYDDYHLLIFLVGLYQYDVIVHDFFFEFKHNYLKAMQSQFPNVRVLCVKDPQSAIDNRTISVTCTGPTS